MIHRIRRPDGTRADIECGPGPVGLMPKTTLHGWGIEVAAATFAREPRRQHGDSERAQYLRDYRERKRQAVKTQIALMEALAGVDEG